MESNQNSTEHSRTSQNSNLRSEVRRLVLDSARRYPGQEMSKESLQAVVDDWLVLADEVGLMRFTDGVRRTWQYCEFFPKPINIRELMPSPRMKDGERWNQELRGLEQRKRAGEKFYTLADVFSAVASKIRTGAIKPKNPSWFEWAKQFKGKTNA